MADWFIATEGVKAIILSRRLRKLVHLPGSRLDATKWSAQPALWQVWRQERHRRAREYIPARNRGVLNKGKP